MLEVSDFDNDDYYYTRTFSADCFSNEKDEEWKFLQAKDVLIYIEKISKDVLIYIEKISKTKVLLTTKNGEIILENFESDKVKLLIAVISTSGLEISNIQYEYNVWIEFIILPLTLFCILGYVLMLNSLLSTLKECSIIFYVTFHKTLTPWLLRIFDFSLIIKIFLTLFSEFLVVYLCVPNNSVPL